MKLLMRLALRNIRRNRWRTAVTLAIVAFSTWAMITLLGLTDGSAASWISAQVALDTGDLQVHRAGYLDDPDLENTFTAEQLDALSAELATQPEVVQTSPRLVTEGLLKSAYGSQGTAIRGIHPDLEPRVTELDQGVIEGRFLQAPGEILMGKALAEKLDVRLDERVVLQVQGLSRPRSKGFRVVGLTSTGLGLLDQLTVFIPLADAQTLTEVDGASEVVVALTPNTDPQKAAPALQERLGPEVVVSSFFDLNPLIADSLKLQNYENLIWIGLIALLAGFGVANTITFTVLERMREFGVMLSLGLRPKQLSRLITLESMFVSGLGFLLGAVLGFGLNLYLEQVGINLGYYMEAWPELGVPSVIYSKVAWTQAVYAFVVVMVTAIVAARYPARRAAKLEPTEAMRYV